jgi:hypothetical protein
VQEIAQPLVLLVAACGAAFLGWRVAHAPDKTYRLFTFGLTAPSRYGIGFFKIVGWCWAVGGVFAVVLYLVLMIVGVVRVLS